MSLFRITSVAIALFASATCSAQAVSDQAVMDQAVVENKSLSDNSAVIRDLGDGQYGVGFINVDKPNRRFEVRGRIAHVDEPLEYVAVTHRGRKDYESLLILYAEATHFQIACILIGLDDKESVKPRYQFDERAVEGPVVAVEISWESDGKSKTVSAHEALLSEGKALPEQDWRFIGSYVENNGVFMAEAVGTLIGFVHDPVAIIENRDGLGIGAFGIITGNSGLLPPEGAPVTVSVSAITENGGEESKAKTTGEQ